MRIERIAAQAFRGYPERIDIALSGDVVLVFGENGAGKTSLTEAFEWALYGTSVRKARSKTPGEYRGTDWVRSAHAEEGVDTFAEVELVTDAGERHIIRRTLRGRSSELTVDGRSSSDVHILGIRTEDAFRPFLGQCEIQAVIDSEQQDRWEQLSAILGFGELGIARQRMQRLRTDADHDRRVRTVRDMATRAVQPLTQPGEDPLATAPDSLRNRAAGFLGLPLTTSWDAIHERAIEALDALYARDRRPRGISELVAVVPDARPIADRLAAAVQTVVDEVVAHREWHRSNLAAELARAGLELADPHSDICPMCLHPTLTSDRRGELRRMSVAGSERPPDNRATISALVRELVGPTPINLRAAGELLDRIDEPTRGRLSAAVVDATEIGSLKESVQGLSQGVIAAADAARFDEGDDASLRNLAAQLVDAATSIADREAILRATAEAIVIDLTAASVDLSDDERARLAGLQKAKLLAENAQSIEAAWRVRQLQTDLAQLIQNLEIAEKRLMESALTVLSSDVAAYYEELSPGRNITIKGISVRETRNRQASIEAVAYGRAVNPVTTFSEAQGNCLGLSLYFSQRVDRNPGWRTILLDDPVQSMDGGHEQGLIGLLARVSRNHQVIVLTHDYRFAESLEAQFRAVPSFTRYNIVLSEGPQPSVEVAAGRLNELLDFAEKNAAGGRALRESCAGAIRKAVERFVADLASAQDVQLAKRLTLEDRINRVHQQHLIDDIEVGTLHRLRRFGARGAHDDPLVNPSDTAIRSSVRALRELQDRRLNDEPLALTIVSGGRQAAG